MIRCTHEARAACPTGQHCEPWAEFREGSECDIFNRQVEEQLASGAKARFDRIKAMGLGEMAQFLDKAALCPWCMNLESCIRDMEHDRAIPEDRCQACIIGWLLSDEKPAPARKEET